MVITARKQNLGQGNVFRSFCLSTAEGGGALCAMSLPVQGGLCPGGSVSRGGLCPGGGSVQGDRETP